MKLPLLLFFTVLLSLNACKKQETPPSAYQENIAAITTILDSTEVSQNYHGSVLIADSTTILLQKAFGVDQNGDVPNQVSTKYEIASMGKMFTAVAIMQLLEAHKISLKTTIGEVLPDYPNEEAKVITIKQLLSHTSGLGDFFGPEFDQNKDAIKNLDDYLPYFANDSLEFQPGERMRYSNAGFVVLGLMIEQISKKDYNTYLTDHVFQPAGMTSTGPLASSAGGGKSTVSDLHNFALALQNNTLINEASFSLMTTDHFGHGYGYGMSLRDLNGKRIYGHNGGAPGVAGELDMVAGEPLIVITLSNRSPMEGWAQLRTHLRKEFFGTTPEIEQFLNTEEVIKTYKQEGFEEASKKLAALDNNISDRNTFGFAEYYANQGQPEKAVDILKLIVQAYPDQWYPYSFLADFQLQAGHKEEAIQNYKKSLDINPQNEVAIQQLEKLAQ
ncbi:serine hydrolase [Flavobacteriaceae bacterium M23B6Z8]